MFVIPDLPALNSIQGSGIHEHGRRLTGQAVFMDPDLRQDDRGSPTVRLDMATGDVRFSWHWMKKLNRPKSPNLDFPARLRESAQRSGLLMMPHLPEPL
jgi:hypothetical protein